MTFIDLVKQRESVRQFLDKPVSREIIDRCIEAARLAPSACNSQPWKFVVVDHPELRSEIAQTTWSKMALFNKFVQNAPVLVVITVEKSGLAAQIGGFLKDKPYYLFDIGIAAEHFCLQAAEENLGTCMLGWFDEKRVQTLLNIPPSRRVALIIAVGHSKHDTPREKRRKTLDEIRVFNRY
jgi:nitroreductase